MTTPKKTKPPMTPAEIKAARRQLNLSTAQLGALLKTDGQTVRRYEMDPDYANTARRITPAHAEILKALVSGYRPPEWPVSGRFRTTGRVPKSRTVSGA